MQTKTIELQVADNVETAIKWLKSEYPHGLDLIYVDYREQYEDMTDLQKMLKTGEDYADWMDDGSWETKNEILKNYLKETGADELSEEVQDAMRDWLGEHDTSNPTKELLAHTGSKLCYIETRDYSNQDEAINTGTDPKDYRKLVKKYGKTEAQAQEVRNVLDNQFYGAPVSFYFYADMEDLFTVLHGSLSGSKYIQIDGAYFSTIDRVQGSNWLGEKAIFTLTIPRADFIKSLFLDEAKGTGYGWNEIAGQTGYDDAGVCAIATKTKGSILFKAEISEAQKRENRLQDNWDKNKTCTFGDMKQGRHVGPIPYENNYPCGSKCQACGTFWID